MGDAIAGRPAAGALDAGLTALRHRDLSEHELEVKLAAKGFTADECEEAVVTLKRTGLLDERRFAEARASALAARGAGDALINDTLEQAGVAPELAGDALAALAPERERAEAIVARRGASPKTARYLAAKGFSRETVEEVVASATGDELG